MNLATLLIIMWVTVLIGICFIIKRLNTIEDKIDKLEEELHYIHVHGFDKERREIFLEDFKKAMKGD